MHAPVGVGSISVAQHAFKGPPQNNSESAESAKGRSADSPAHKAWAEIEATRTASDLGQAAPANLHGKVTSAIARGITIDISNLLVLQTDEPIDAENQENASVPASDAGEESAQVSDNQSVTDELAGFRTDELPIKAISAESAPGANGAPADTDLIFLDFEFSGKGGVPGGNGGGGNGGGGSDPTVLSEYVSGDEGGYNIEINFKGSWTSDLQEAFINSSELISDLIVGDIDDVFYRGKIIDDIRIDAKLTDIDGEGGILGQAGPTAIRTDGYLPATAIMEFDVADAASFNAMPSGSEGTLWDDIVTHELLHSIGFGSIWTYQGLLSGGGTDNPTFAGENATAAYEAAYGVTNSGGVPVEQDGGPGTRDSHWDEETFGNEIMTGYINNFDNYLSDMTVASLEDVGYDTVWS